MIFFLPKVFEKKFKEAKKFEFATQKDDEEKKYPDEIENLKEQVLDFYTTGREEELENMEIDDIENLLEYEDFMEYCFAELEMEEKYAYLIYRFNKATRIKTASKRRLL